MGITSGYSDYVCEGCDAQAWVKDDDNTAKSKWRTIERVTADSALVRRLLCEKCHKAYSAFAAGQDADFNAFMASRRAS